MAIWTRIFEISSVADPILLYLNPDPTWRVTTDPDPDTNPTWRVISDHDLDSTLQVVLDPDPGPC